MLKCGRPSPSVGMSYRGFSRRARGSLALPALLALLCAVPALPLTSGAGHAAVPRPAAPGAAPAPVGHPAPTAFIPRHPHHVPSPYTSQLAVNPMAFYTAQPAPMGIADFGVDHNGNGHRYTTDAFFGQTSIHDLSVDLGGSTQLTIQLNVVLEFSVGGASYQYWIQDVAWVDTSVNQSSFENNIWNFTSNASGLDSNSVSGNGSVYSGVFYAVYSTGPGTGAILTYPANIGLLAVAKVLNGTPEVVFEYQNGYGMQTYDNVLFPFAKGAQGVNFIVDGTQYNPYGLYDDAELILGGPGGGSQTAATAANLTMSLAYDNGHNFQAVPQAYNFGSDTAEGISGVGTHRAAPGANGTLADNVTVGSSALALLYDRSYSSYVNISTPFTSGNLSIGGKGLTAFQGNPINVTIAPGTYAFDIYNASGRVGTKNATITAGSYTALSITAGYLSTVHFVETGLTSHHRWSITLGATTSSSTSDTIGFLMINGSYNFQLTAIPGFIANLSRGSVLVQGSQVTVLLSFIQVVYGVQLFETGLPDNTTWSVTVNNQTHATSTGLLVFTLPNGSYSYTLGIVPGWSAAPNAHGSLTVNAAAIRRTLTFHQFTYGVLAQSTGLPRGTVWGIEIGTIWTNGSISTILANVPNGSYTYRVTAGSGYIASPTTGNLTVFAAPAFLNITFIPYLYPITFSEVGLLPGVSWKVQFGSDQQTSSNASIVFAVPNGTYSYTVFTPSGYLILSTIFGQVTVNGVNSTIAVRFHAPPVVNGYLVGSVQPADSVLSVNRSTVPFVGGSFNISLAPGPYFVELTHSGYHPFFTNVTIVAGSRTVLKAVNLVPIGSQGPPPSGTKSSSPSSELLGLSNLEWGILVGVIVAVGIGGLVLLRRRAHR